MFFHNGSNYNHNFIIKELAKEFAKKFNCLGENNKKYESLQFQKQKTKRIDRYEKSEELYLNLSNLDGNLAEELIKLNTKTDIIMENVKYVQLKTKTVSAVLNTHTLKMN